MIQTLSEARDSLAVLTRVSRINSVQELNKLIALADSVERLSKSLEDSFNVKHFIIFDKSKVHRTDLLILFANYVKKAYACTSYVFEYRGKSDLGSYGARMLIDCTSDMKSCYLSDKTDPYLYILDDDNIIHDNFASLVKKYKWSDCIVLFGQSRNMSRFSETGERTFEDSIPDKTTFLRDSFGNITDDLQKLNQVGLDTHPDSAQFIIRHSTLIANGNYADTYFIDLETIYKIYKKDQSMFVFDPTVASYYNINDSELVK